MANTKISGLPAASTVNVGDTVLVTQAGVSKQATSDLLPKQALLATAAVSTSASGTFAIDTVQPIDASAAAASWTLPSPTRIGQLIRVEKVDSSSNTVTAVGTLRGISSTFALLWPFQSIDFVAESLTSWRPANGRMTKASLDTAYKGANGQASFTGDGTKVVFKIPHNLGVSPTGVSITPSTVASGAANAYVSSVDSTFVNITCPTAPTNGTALGWYWRVSP